jgi:hypothetical protein
MGLYKRKGSRFYWMSFRINGKRFTSQPRPQIRSWQRGFMPEGLQRLKRANGSQMRQRKGHLRSLRIGI